MSRLYAGIHFPMDNTGGQAEGACIGRAVLARVHTRTTP
jgi:membrane-associated phospholipid phosphatase